MPATRKQRLHERRERERRAAKRDALTIKAALERYDAALKTHYTALRAGAASRKPVGPFKTAYYKGAVQRELGRARRRASEPVS